MPKFLLDNMSTEQLQHLSHHLINSSPLGVIIMNDALEIVFVNTVAKVIFGKEDFEGSPFFGELFQCKYVADTDYRCGSRRQCDNCRIRNSLLNASYFDRVIDQLKVKQAFLINGIETIKWFDITVIPTVVNRSSHLVLILNDQTDRMNNAIEIELSEMLGQSLPQNVELFSQQIIQSIKNSSDKYKNSYLMKITGQKQLQMTVDGLEMHTFAKKTFRTFLLQQLNVAIPILDEKMETTYLFFVNSEAKEIKTLTQKLNQFCELNFEHTFKVQYQILQLDIRNLMMTDLSLQKIINEVELWINYINTIPEGLVTPYPLDPDKT